MTLPGVRRRASLLVFGFTALTASLAPSASASSSVPFPFAALQAAAPPLDAFAAQARAAAQGVPPGIVRGLRTRLVVDGLPWRFLGFNDYMLSSPSDSGFTCGGTHWDAEADADFAQMHALGVTVVRTWFFQSYVAGRGWSAFDRVLSDAAKYGIKIIPVLSNQFGTCESYNHTQDVYKSLAWYRSGYTDELDSGLPKTYHDYALNVAAHYKGDPRIAFWQLMNEAEAAAYLNGPCDEGAATAALRSFADAMTAAVKSVDPAHLVSLGTIGSGQCGIRGDDYVAVHSGLVDLCEYHDYTATPASTPRTNPCAGINKPVFAGERGFLSDGYSGHTTPQTLAARASMVRTDITNTFAGDCCAGYLLWQWTSGASNSYDIGPRDPVTGVIRSLSASVTSPLIALARLWLAARS